jgi:hypothetical protein
LAQARGADAPRHHGARQRELQLPLELKISKHVGDKPLPIAVTLAVKDGNYLEAIRQIRDAEGLDLVRAKARFDLYLEGNPALRETIDEVRRGSRRRLIRKVLIFDAIVVVALIWWFVLR